MTINLIELLFGGGDYAVGVVFVFVVMGWILYKFFDYFFSGKKTSQQWYTELHSSDHQIADPDGWRNAYGSDKALEAFQTVLVTKEEYMKMHDESTIIPLENGKITSYFS